jgi:hypothetical protein
VRRRLDGVDRHIARDALTRAFERVPEVRERKFEPRGDDDAHRHTASCEALGRRTRRASREKGSFASRRGVDDDDDDVATSGDVRRRGDSFINLRNRLID